MPTKSLARHNVVAVVADQQRGRDLLHRLHDEGIDPALTSMRGREQAKTPGPAEPHPSRIHSLSDVGRTMVAGGIAGAVIGAVVVGFLSFVFDMLFSWWLPWYAALGLGALTGAIMGSTAGSMLGLQVAGRRSQMLEQSLTPLLPRIQEQDVVLVAVHTDDPDQADQVAQALEQVDDVMAVHRHETDESFRPPGLLSGLLGRTIPSGTVEERGGKMFDLSSQ